MNANALRKCSYFSFLFFFMALIYTGACGSAGTSSETGTFTLRGSSSQSASSSESEFINPAVSASSVSIKIYDAWISTSETCANPTKVFHSESGETFNMASSPTISSTSVAQGTYPCIIAKMSDNITFSPQTSEGSCTAGASYTIDVCRAEENRSSTDPDGNTVTCTGTHGVPAVNQITIYISTFSTNDITNGGSGNEFAAPTASNRNQGIKLSSPLVVTATTSGTFFTDFTNKISGAQSSCDLDPPVFGFR